MFLFLVGPVLVILIVAFLLQGNEGTRSVGTALLSFSIMILALLQWADVREKTGQSQPVWLLLALTSLASFVVRVWPELL